VAALALTAVEHAPPRGNAPPVLLLAAFLAWRVFRGGLPSQAILIGLTLIAFAENTFAASGSWHPVVLGLLAIYAAQLMLLMSPALYLHTQYLHTQHLHTHWDTLPSRRRVLLRWLPPAWMTPSALLAGLAVTLAYLSNAGLAPVPGCGPAGVAIARLPGRCFGETRGYPLRFVLADGNASVIGKAALVTDWAQWSLVSFTVLYLIWQVNRRNELRGDRPVPQDRPRPVRA
jgi:hypothetical protein